MCIKISLRRGLTEEGPEGGSPPDSELVQNILKILPVIKAAKNLSNYTTYYLL